MTETPHPAVVARRRRLHQIRVRVATGAVGLFIAVFSVIYAQLPSSAGATTATQTPSSDNADNSTASSTQSQAQSTPMTTSQS
jgi:hypothetical protein